MSFEYAFIDDNAKAALQRREKATSALK